MSRPGALDCRGFAPSSRPDARLLILGSMPGAASLEAAQYYAHPRNAFWWLAAELWGVPADAAYEARLAALHRAGVALWDVLARCEREGSLDQAIARGSEEAQPLAAFVARHPQLRLVAFNGAKAEEAWRRHVLPRWPEDQPMPPTVRLPSSSPAHAALDRAAKLRRWREALAGAVAT